jgi:tight adherence protein B
MHLTRGDIPYALGLLGIFGAVLLLGLAIYSLAVSPIRRRFQLQRRLRAHLRKESRDKVFKSPHDEQQSPTLFIGRRLAGWHQIENFKRQMLQADISWNPGTFLSLACLMSGVGFFLGQVWGFFLVSFALALTLGLLPFLFLRWKKARKTNRFERQMPAALELFSRSLRAGHTLAAAIDLVGREVSPPLGLEMRTVYEEQHLGLSLPAALQNLSKRVDSTDLRFFITAVLIQFDTGGNLAEIMDKIARMIRARINFKAKIQGLTAEGRFSAVILGILPLAIFLALSFLSPDYIQILLREPLGQKMLLGAIISILLGALIMHRLIQVKV